jgi:hypothetical protein
MPFTGLMHLTGRRSGEASRCRRVVRMACIGGLAALTSVAMASCGSPSFPTDHGTATITWRSLPNNGATKSPPQPYSGTVAGIPVSGRALPPPPIKPGSVTSIPTHLPLAQWTGTFEGHAFSVKVVANFSSANLSSFTVDADGTFGSQAVRIIAGPAPASSNTISFHGTIGHHHVTGSVRPGVSHGTHGKATATFTVTG